MLKRPKLKPIMLHQKAIAAFAATIKEPAIMSDYLITPQKVIGALSGEDIDFNEHSCMSCGNTFYSPRNHSPLCSHCRVLEISPLDFSER